MTARQRCAKRVHSGARGDTGGHLCGHYAQDGTEFCHLHQPDRAKTERVSTDPLTDPETSSRTQVKRFATLTWEPGQGPVMPIPYQDRSGFVTIARATQVDDGEMDVRAVGVVRKKDGTPGQQTWEAHPYRGHEGIPSGVVAMLAGLLAEERSRG